MPLASAPAGVLLASRRLMTNVVCRPLAIKANGSHHGAANRLELADYFPYIGCNCYYVHVHAYQSLCVRAQLVEVGPDLWLESLKTRHSARRAHNILIRNISDKKIMFPLDLSLEDD